MMGRRSPHGPVQGAQLGEAIRAVFAWWTRQAPAGQAGPVVWCWGVVQRTRHLSTEHEGGGHAELTARAHPWWEEGGPDAFAAVAQAR